MTDFVAARRTMVENQLRTYDVTDQPLLAAFETVPREDFVAGQQAEIAYLDRELTARDGKTRLLTPMVLARMAQSLAVQAGERVLDVGGGGYGAALFRALGAEVTSLEAGPASLAAGVPDKAPFDAILVHGSAEADPVDLIRQLKDGGRLMIVMGKGRSGRATLFRRISGATSRNAVFDAAAPALPDFALKPAFQF